MTKTEALWNPDILTVPTDTSSKPEEKKTITLKQASGPVVVDIWPARKPSGATPILLIHGWGGSGSYWQDTARRLSETVQVIVPDFGTVEGPFQITNLEIAGRHDGEVTFDVALESAGELTFTAI